MSGVEPARSPASSSPWAAVSAWGLWALIVLSLAVIFWLDRLIRLAGPSELNLLKPSDIPYTVATLSAAGVGTLLISRRPRHPVGWLLLLFGLTVAGAGVTHGYARYVLLVRPGTLPGGEFAAMYPPNILLAWFACIGFILLLTPTGSLPSPRWRWWAGVAVTAPVLFAVSHLFGPRLFDAQFQSIDNPFAIPALAVPLLILAAAAAAAAAASMLVAVGSVVFRFRSARGVERLQLRWLALASGVTVALAVVVVAGTLLGAAALVVISAGIYVAVLPLAVAAAILRYRMYDLDRIISRTLAYTLLTVLLGAGYAVIVLGLGRLLGQDQPSLAVAGATLAVAAAFQPARRRIQDLVERRFNRRRYDAERTIAAFSGRLRQQTDLDALTAELLTVVDQTMQPTHAALWLRPAAERGGGVRVRG